MLLDKVQKKNYFIINNEVWALIPARIGSKSIKKKNLQKISGISILEHTIKTANSCKKVQRVFVSTDSKLIKKIAINKGAEVDGLRAENYSKDNSSDFEVFKDFFSKRKNKSLPEYFVYLRPTTPLRDYKMIDRAITHFKKLINYDSMVSVHEMSETAYKKFIIKKNFLKPLFNKFSLDDANKPRQNFIKTYSGNGYFDIVKTKNIFKKKYLGDRCFPFVTEKVVDINNHFDLQFARYLKSFILK
jgi:CMP-N,N'-diacetyllegionaminic acid synthase